MSRTLLKSFIGLSVLAALLLVPLTAWAHESVESGSFVFEIGWLQEPVIVGERNGLELFVAPKDTPEEGIADITTLQFTVEYGSASQSYDLVPVEESPGHYSAAFIPMVEGQYTFHLTGTVNDEAVDVSVDPEEVVARRGAGLPVRPRRKLGLGRQRPDLWRRPLSYSGPSPWPSAGLPSFEEGRRLPYLTRWSGG